MGNILDDGLLAKVAIEVFEDAAFIFAEKTEDRKEWPNEVITSSIPFSGDRNGTLSMTIEPEFAGELAANLLGMDPFDKDVQTKGAEALSETLNIVCGLFLEQWLGENSHCSMGVPNTHILSKDEYEATIASAKVNASLLSEEGSRIDITVQ